MSVKSSSNCCINIWEDTLESYCDVYVIFPEYMGDEPITNGTYEIVVKAYKEAIKSNTNLALIKLHIEEVLDKNEIEYIRVLVMRS